MRPLGVLNLCLAFVVQNNNLEKHDGYSENWRCPLLSVLKVIESAQTFFMQMKHKGLCITAS